MGDSPSRQQDPTEPSRSRGPATFPPDLAFGFDVPIVRPVLTHAHSDHAGSLGALHALLPEAEVLFTTRTAQVLNGDTHLEAGEPQVKIRGAVATCTTRATRTIAAGDRIKSLQVVSSPGHTPDHIALFDTRDGTLIAGDSFQTRGGVAVTGMLVPLFPFPALATWHKPTALQSALSLRNLQPTAPAVGHGDIVLNPLARMDRAIARARRGLTSVESHAR